MTDYTACKFYRNGECYHKDAPPEDRHCLGKDGCGAWEDDISYRAKGENNYRITESVSGEVALVSADNPQDALLDFIKQCFPYNPQSDSWNFDIEIERVK